MADPELGASHEAEGEETWAGDFDPFSDPEERRVLFAAFDSFRYVRSDENEDLAFFSSVLAISVITQLANISCPFHIF